MASKVTSPGHYFVLRADTENAKKTFFFRKTLCHPKFLTLKFFGTGTIGTATDSAFRISVWKEGTKIFWPCFGRPKPGECDYMRSVSKNMRCCKQTYLLKFSKLRLTTQITSSQSLWEEVICAGKLNFADFGRYVFFRHRNVGDFFLKRGSTSATRNSA